MYSAVGVRRNGCSSCHGGHIRDTGGSSTDIEILEDCRLRGTYPACRGPLCDLDDNELLVTLDLKPLTRDCGRLGHSSDRLPRPREVICTLDSGLGAIIITSPRRSMDSGEAAGPIRCCRSAVATCGTVGSTPVCSKEQSSLVQRQSSASHTTSKEPGLPSSPGCMSLMGLICGVSPGKMWASSSAI